MGYYQQYAYLYTPSNVFLLADHAKIDSSSRIDLAVTSVGYMTTIWNGKDKNVCWFCMLLWSSIYVTTTMRGSCQLIWGD